LSEDPIGFKSGDYNLYMYVKNNPITYTDPKGESATLLAFVGICLAAKATQIVYSTQAAITICELAGGKASWGFDFNWNMIKVTCSCKGGGSPGDNDDGKCATK